MEKSNQKENKIISVKNLYKSFKTGYRYTRVLKDVSLDVNAGEFLIVFGPSGCGKSTLLHVMMGLERPDKGFIKLEGTDLWKLNTPERADIRKKKLGIMYQQQNWIKALTVQENIALSGQLIGLEKEEAIERTKEVLHKVGMDARTEYIPSELSAGEQQKIGLARALMTDPAVIIADEPTGNLDVKSGQEMMRIFSELNEEGKTIIMVTHNPEYLKYGSRVALMLDGYLRRVITVDDENADQIHKEITTNLRKFIEMGTHIEPSKADEVPPIVTKEDNTKRNIFEGIMYMIRFNIHFIFQSIMFLLLMILRKLSNMSNFFYKRSVIFKRRFAKISRAMEKKNGFTKSINSIDLTAISFKNLWVKKSRTMITIFGMAIGIGFIVFLLSLGYGLERLVINEITRIEDLRQVDVTPTISSSVRLDEENMTKIFRMDGIEQVLPLINMAARVKYQSSSTDVVVFAVQPEYITTSRLGLSEGEVFSDDEPGVIVNAEFLRTVGSIPSDAIGRELETDFVLSEIIEDEDDPPSTTKTFEIVGVIDDRNPAVIYVPILELEDFNITEFSQLRIIVESEDKMIDARRQIEVLGFETTSVMDTVSEVEGVFVIAKIGLLVVGAIALTIAILGMFNTLTVSLLERTREVGLMKTLGMKADEISSLFINESMLMSITGGTLGVLFGLFLGIILSLTISLISVSRGGEYIMVSFLPFWLILTIIFTSTFVGFLTGLYPSNRAVKMAPLDALRYE